MTTLHQFNSLLASEWYERTAIWLLQDLIGAEGLYSKWDKEKPYARGSEAVDYDYPAYRRLKFEQFLKNITDKLPRPVQDDWDQRMKDITDSSLDDYQRQMSILAYLDPGPFGETRVPFNLEEAHIGIIHNGNYYLLPACEPGTSNILDVRTARSQIINILSLPPKKSAGLKKMASIRRAELPGLRKRLSAVLQEDLKKLQHTPILINADRHIKADTLSAIRSGERGIGDHALTIFDTGNSFVFDQSHIFFDGGWGAALAEIMTNEALSWAVYLSMLSPAPSGASKLYDDLQFTANTADAQLINNAPTVTKEAGAENDRVNVRVCLNLRKYFNQRSELLKLTINDILVLYRAIHADTYRPSKKLEAALEALGKDNPKAVNLIRQVFTVSVNTNPSILIPVDASRHFPRDRVYPLNLEVPLADLDLLNLHAQTLNALADYEATPKHDNERYAQFDELQRRYLATLGGFGTILAKAKQIAVMGESASVGAIKITRPPALPA